MERKTLQTLLAIAIAALPAVYLKLNFDRLPDQIALHFGVDGQPDRWGSKSDLWIPVLLLSGAGLLTYFLMGNLHWLDPKKYADKMPDTLRKIGLATAALCSGIGLMVVHGAVAGTTPSSILVTLMGIFFAFLGNLMHSLKPNYFVGIRLPWTLESEQNWRKTHQLTSKIWVAGGLLLAVQGLLLSTEMAFKTMIVVLVTISIIPIIYSFGLFRNEKKV